MQQGMLVDCSILLLAGGQGRRMGGRDKGLVEWHGKPLIAWSHRVTRPMTDDLLISCNRNHHHYAAFADKLVVDGNSDFAGPLAGIRAGIAAASHPFLMILPCDAPLIDETLLRQLYSAAIEAPNVPVMARRGDQWEPLFCIVPTGLGPAIEAAWNDGERSNRRVLSALDARALDLEVNDPRLANLNSPELLSAQPPPSGT